MHVHLGGYLSWYDPQKRSRLEVSQPVPASLLEVAARLGVPTTEIAIAVVNGRVVDLATAVAAAGDRVDFYPPLGGG